MRSLLLGSALFLLSILPSHSWAQKPAGLMVDLVKEAGALYQKGYPADVKMQDLNDGEIDNYQFAEMIYINSNDSFSPEKTVLVEIN